MARLIKVITGIRRCGKSYLLDPIFFCFIHEGRNFHHPDHRNCPWYWTASEAEFAVPLTGWRYVERIFAWHEDSIITVLISCFNVYNWNYKFKRWYRLRSC